MRSVAEEQDIEKLIYLGIAAVDDDHCFHCQVQRIHCPLVLFVVDRQVSQILEGVLEEHCAAVQVDQQHVDELAAAGIVEMGSLDSVKIVSGVVDLEVPDLYQNDVPDLKTKEKQLIWHVIEKDLDVGAVVALIII